MYGFGSGHRTKTIKANRKLAEELKFEKGYIYKVLTEDSRKGIYQHPIIQMGVSKLWFNNKRDEGVIYSDMFDPMPVPAIALILTTIECSIDEWTTGTKTDGNSLSRPPTLTEHPPAHAIAPPTVRDPDPQRSDPSVGVHTYTLPVVSHLSLRVPDADPDHPASRRRLSQLVPVP
ncbi:hypothetical protein D9615_006757 [Tricholomella constricta]|uniref:DUF6532 domain-containing protein n=1 Tax=Tricholomella constricta TaxID=117010 RepID=A0A8H5M295_9AGAR|nr:hypothetical protein D9615_006757 [Tricholomella constricta]